VDFQWGPKSFEIQFFEADTIGKFKVKAYKTAVWLADVLNS
jgi:hypothetical protein